MNESSGGRSLVSITLACAATMIGTAAIILGGIHPAIEQETRDAARAYHEAAERADRARADFEEARDAYGREEIACEQRATPMVAETRRASPGSGRRPPAPSVRPSEQDITDDDDGDPIAGSEDDSSRTRRRLHKATRHSAPRDTIDNDPLGGLDLV